VGGRAALKLPPALGPGDLVAVAAPASAFDRTAFRRGAEFIAARGYRVAYREDIFGRAGSFAGDDARRAAELNGWIRDPEVRAILMARGGWGCARIANRLDWRALARRPKAVAGFSDLTTLLLAVTQRAGIAAFHGPMVASSGKQPGGLRDLSRLLALLEGDPAALVHRGLRALRPGRVRAPLAGGNLSLLANTAGTPFALEARGRILFVEEVNEPLYRVDRAVRRVRRRLSCWKSMTRTRTGSSTSRSMPPFVRTSRAASCSPRPVALVARAVRRVLRLRRPRRAPGPRRQRRAARRPRAARIISRARGRKRSTGAASSRSTSSLTISRG